MTTATNTTPAITLEALAEDAERIQAANARRATRAITEALRDLNEAITELAHTSYDSKLEIRRDIADLKEAAAIARTIRRRVLAALDTPAE